MTATPSSDREAPGHWQVGEFRLDPAANELAGPGRAAVRIEPRVMALLLRLAREPGAVVGREALIEAVWSRRMVNDEVLSRAIADLRQVLGDDSRAPRYIETIPKSGYRLIAPVSRGAPSGSAPAPLGPGGPAPAALARRLSPATRILAVSLCVLLVLLAAAAYWGVRRGGQMQRLPQGDLLPALTATLQEAQPLTAEQGMEISGRLSPDGRALVYTLVRNGQSVLRWMDLSTRRGHTLDTGPGNAAHALFTPDGRAILFAQGSASGCRLRRLALGPDGTAAPGGVQDLWPCPDGVVRRMDLSPDGSALLLSRTAQASLPAGLATLALATGQLRDLTRPTLEEGHDTLPRYSPDGREIAFVRGNSSSRAVHVMPAEGGASRRVSNAAGLVYGIEWLAPGGPLLVSTDWHGTRSLALLDPATRESRLAGARGARFPEARGGWLVYEHAIYQADLFLVRPGEAPQRRHASTRYSSQPVYSPTGDQWAFVSNREGSEGVYLAQAEGEARRLSPTGDHRYMRPAFSRNGQQVLALRSSRLADKSGPQEAVSLDLATGRESVLPLGRNVGWIGQTADGAAWLFAEREGRLLRLWRRPVDGSGAAERLPLPLMNDLRVLGDRLVFSQTGLEGLTVCDLSTLACRPLKVPIGASHDDHWALSEQAVIFATNAQAGAGGRPRALMRQPFSGAAATPFGDLPPTTLGAGLAVHPREREHIVARESEPEIDLMLARWPPR